jgi:hypothetical protein
MEKQERSPGAALRGANLGGDASAPGAITLRAVLLGALSGALLGYVNPYLAFVARTWSVGSGSLLGGPVVALFGLVALNGLLARFWPARAFRRGELLIAYAMLILSAGLTMQGGMPYIVSATTYPFYMASPSNNWENLMWPHIPPWLRLAHLESVNVFWEGLPEGTGVPWSDWVSPLVAWSVFTLALMAAIFCLGSLLSKDWIERQRLTFPLVDVPLAITGDSPRPSLGSTILMNRIFWLGFSLPALLAVLGFLHRFFPSMPAPELTEREVGRYFAGLGLPWSVLGDMRVSLLFPVIGITCLLPGEVSLSLWLFYVLFRVQLLAWGSFGVAPEGQNAAFINPRAFIAFEEAGGFLALSGVLLYQSRGALAAAARSLVSRARGEPDPYAALSGRGALVGLVAANAFLVWWAVRAGMSWWSFALLMGMFYAVLLGAARLVAAGGVMYVDTGFFPRQIVMRTVGAVPIGPASLAMYSYLSVIYMYDPMNLAMPQMMNSFRLLHSARLRSRAFPWAAAVSVVAVLAVGLPALVRVVCQYGATSLQTWPFTSYPQWAFGEYDASLRAPELPDNWLRVGLGVGALVMLGLSWLNSTFVWWPVSPVGFVIASAYETDRSIWLNALIAWAISTAIRRYGGLKLFRELRPAFLGLVLGQYLTSGALAIVASIFGLGQPVA